MGPNNQLPDCITGDDSGNVFVTGWTEGNIDTETGTVGYIFLTKFSSDGDTLWNRQFGPSGEISVNAIAADKDGNCFLVGQTSGAINETNPAGGNDAYIVKYDPNGIMLWEQLLGTNMDENATAITVDANSNCYITGSTGGTLIGAPVRGSRCPFVAKYNTEGELLWVDQLRQVTAQEGYAILIHPDGTIYTSGKPGYIAQHDPNGVLIDYTPITVSDYCGANFDDHANLYACGWTANITGFMEKYSPSGERLWRRNFREAGWTAPKYVVMCTDDSNDVLTGGCQQGPDGPNDCQAFFRRFDPDGNQTMRYDFPGSGSTCGFRVGVDSMGSCLQTGGKNASDAMVIKLGYPDNTPDTDVSETQIDNSNPGAIINPGNGKCTCRCLQNGR